MMRHESQEQRLTIFRSDAGKNVFASKVTHSTLHQRLPSDSPQGSSKDEPVSGKVQEEEEVC